ncbi:adaptin complex 1 subunit [Trypanosoma brucei equiperdum]|uniref:Adaptin complex 1 subunit n=1 Tax=Trypanosoma brucei equiperdum TaxID=630700 RepID=A0A3L6KW29_9TRYP|nr:adaptin complex 1 subunit [Trypanosoma brucei equiperdum]
MEAVLRKVEKLKQNFRHSGGGSKFFNTAWRGEGTALQHELNSNDKSRQKNAVKRIIAGMTMGRDVSHLFMDVVKLGQTTNLELKKLVYLYVLSNAKLQPGKALMAVNTFLQDTTNPSPVVRALAVRTMMCVRVDSVTEYTLEPLRRAVNDLDPYVRKNAVIGIGKLFHNSRQLYEDQGFSTELLKLLTDKAAVVVSNAAAVVMEVNSNGGTPIVLERHHIMHLLDQIPGTTEWGQLNILELVSCTRPGDDRFAEDVVSRVMLQTNHTNQSVVMGAIKVIINYLPHCGQSTVNEVGVRINSALVTLSRGDPEAQYVVCKNIHALLVIFPNLLINNLDSFYVRFSDPPYVKLEKLRLLLKLVSNSSANGILKELEEYSTEVDPFFVEEVVKGIAELALKIDSVAQSCVALLLRIVKNRPELLPQVVTSCKNITRKYPKLLVLGTLISECGADGVVEEEAKVSLIWMLGEFCEFVENGMDIIRKYIEELMLHEPPVQLSILSAVIKMFLRDPQGMEPTLNTVLDALTTQSSDPDIRDRAYAYWRLLSKGIGVAKMKEIVHGHHAAVAVESTFSDAMTMGDLLKSINTAAAVFARPAQSFLPPYGFVTETVAMKKRKMKKRSRSPVSHRWETPKLRNRLSSISAHQRHRSCRRDQIMQQREQLQPAIGIPSKTCSAAVCQRHRQNQLFNRRQLWMICFHEGKRRVNSQIRNCSPTVPLRCTYLFPCWTVWMDFAFHAPVALSVFCSSTLIVVRSLYYSEESGGGEAPKKKKTNLSEGREKRKEKNRTLIIKVPCAELLPIVMTSLPLTPRTLSLSTFGEPPERNANIDIRLLACW